MTTKFQNNFFQTLVIIKLTIVLICFQNVESANILFISPTASYSHSVVYFPIIRELSLRGHKVVTIIPDLINDPKLVNITEINIHDGAYKIAIKDLTQFITQVSNRAPVLTLIKSLDSYSYHAMDWMLQHPDVRNLIRNPEQYHFDVVITEWLTYQSTAAFSDLFKCPLIGISSYTLLLSGYDVIGSPTHPTFFPFIWNEFVNPSSLWQRLQSIKTGIEFRNYYKHHMFPKQEALVKKHFGKNVSRSLTEIEKDVSIILTNTNPILHGAYPKAANLIEFGGIHEQVFKPLSKELKAFLDSAVNGFIYFSLGSNIKSFLLGEKTIAIILKVFKNLPYKILWKYESKNLPGKPDNVYISQWVPQRAVLEHKNIKLFMMQGGLQSSEEAIRAKVPLIIIPFFADQGQNGGRFQQLGIGKLLSRAELSEDVLRDAIYEIINNISYKENIIEVSNTLWDQPTKPLDRAIWWIEYVINHKGAKFLRNPAVDAPWYEVELFDIYLFIFKNVKNANILFISSTASYSHSVIYFPIIRELSLRGHKVVTIIPDLINDPNLINITEIDTHDGAYKIVRPQLVTLIEQIVNDAPTMNNVKWLNNYAYIFLDWMFQHPDVKNLIQRPELYQFDVVITEWFSYQSTVAFAELYKCPLIGISSYSTSLSGYDAIGNPTHPVYFPNSWDDFINPSSFWDRLKGAKNAIEYRNYYKYHMFPKQEALVEKHFGNKISRSLREMVKDVSIVLTNTNPLLHGAYPKAMNLIEFGRIHEQQLKPLPESIKSFLDNAQNGFIYFSLGSNIKSSLLGEKTIATILKVFKWLPYRILWKYESENLSNKPDNVFISQWVPQRAVLEHTNIKLFMTQGGLQSAEEAIRAQVPLIIIPFFADQYQNAGRFQQLGIGKWLSRVELTEQVLNNTIYEVPTKPLDRAIWWIEYVIRHKGAKFLRNPVLDAPWYEVECHSVIYFPIIRELSLRGHKVVTIIPDLINDPKLINITEIDIHDGAYGIIRPQLVTLIEQIVNDAPTMSNVKWLNNYSDIILDWMFQHPDVKNLIQRPELYQFDVVITEWLTYQSTVAFADLYKCPLIGISSYSLFLSGYDAIDSPTHPVYLPNSWDEYINPSSFWDRLISVKNAIEYRNYYKYHMFPKQEALVRKHFGNKISRGLREIEKDVSIVLTNTNPLLHGAYPKALNLIEFGGIHEQQLKPLPENIKSFLDNAQNGFIYFSLGSNIKSYLLGEKTIATILKVFKRLPYKILWKYESEVLLNKPDNVFISQWVPQKTVLEHANIKLFMTQGGLQSAEEAIRAQVPLIIIPFVADQHQNAGRFQQLGIGKCLLRAELTEQVLNNTIYEVIYSKSYKKNIKEISNTLWDQPTKPLDRAIWWIEYVIRHKGAKFLRNPVLDAPCHSVVYFPIIRELSLRGHKVVTIIPDLINDPKLINITEIDIHDGAYGIIRPQVAILVKQITDNTSEMSLLEWLDNFSCSLLDWMFQQPDVQNLIQNSKLYHFDVVITEWLTYQSTVAFAELYNCSLIGISSYALFLSGYDVIGSPTHPVYFPNIWYKFINPASFWERLKSVKNANDYRNYYNHHMLPKQEALVEKYFGNKISRSLRQIEKDVSIVLTNTNPILHGAYPKALNLIEFGGIHEQEYKPLPEDLSGKPDNVFISQWVPQRAVLEHANIKLFMTQGGLQSAEEAIRAQVPLIIIPFASDQYQNAGRFQQLGIGKCLSRAELTEQVLNGTIYEVINTYSYKKNMIEISNTLWDQPTKPLDRAIWWIEYVIRHKGAKFLRNRALDAPCWLMAVYPFRLKNAPERKSASSRWVTPKNIT
ncbi:uncharacterized protein LOC123294226 [Chrysoperla carnea]|uniref:uncharacterized protein LOC123294226 n=1 Tax=Chrysoperla carnea TaxID=189513 RepID=UPI001D06BB9F|nr:uncharacterized protein LOC123294226 [Chrysoperla carnea]